MHSSLDFLFKMSRSLLLMTKEVDIPKKGWAFILDCNIRWGGIACLNPAQTNKFVFSIFSEIILEDFGF